MKLVSSELRLRRRSLIGWSVAIALLVLLIIEVYPSVANTPSLNDIYAELSPSARALLGGSDATSPVGYLSTQMFAFFLPAILLVFVLGRSAATLAGEEEDRTLDLLLAQPLARWSAYLQKSAAITIALAVLSLASLIPLLLFNSQTGLNIPAPNLVAVVVQMFLFCLALGMCTQAISSAAGRKGIGLAIVIGYTVASYLIYGLGQSITWLEHLSPLTLWRWYLQNNPLQNGIGFWECVVPLATCAVATGAGIWLFSRRNLHA